MKRFVCLSNNYGVYPQAFFPAQGGRDYEMSPTLKALERHRADFSVFSNLDHALQGGHACVPSLLSGVMPVVAPNFPEMNMSLDQKLAEHVGAATRYPSMALKVNDANLISFTRTGVQVPAMDLQAMIELIALAMQTDSSRVFTLTSGFANGDFGLRGGYHGFSHHGERDAEVVALKAIEGYQVAMMAHLIDLLKAQPDPLNGGTLFDHTTILYGCGMATGQHSTRNLPILLAGGGFKLGEHRVLPEGRTERLPAANLLLSILRNFGVEAEKFGTSRGTLL